MNNLSQLGYSNSEVIDILTGNRMIGFEYDLLDKNERSIGTVTASGSIDYDASAKISRAGSFQIKESKDIDFLNERIRPRMIVNTPRGYLKYNLGILLLSSPSTSRLNESYSKYTECYDLSNILSEDKFTSRYLINSGYGYIESAISLLNTSGITRINSVTSSKTLSTSMEFEIGTSKLDAINQLLKAVNYNNLYFDNDGNACLTQYVLPQIRNIEFTYQTHENGVVRPGATKEADLFNCPNIIIRYTENPDSGATLISKYENTSPTDRLSTVSRGRNIVDIESVSNIADQGTLDALVQRIVAERQVFETVSFDTALMPHHVYMDCLGVKIDSINFNAKCIETAWNMQLEAGGTMHHKCRKVVSANV